MNKLAVFAPHIGAISESFIRRHMEDLLPTNTVIIAGSNKPPYGGHWNVEVPQFILPDLNNLINLSRRKKAYLLTLQALGIKQNSSLLNNTELKAFLQHHKVSVVLGEYLDVSTTMIDLCNKLGIKLLAHAHGYDISIKLREKYWRKQYLKLNEVSGIITMSEYSKQRLIDIGIREELIHIIPYGVILPPLNINKNIQSAIKCIAVGRMVPKKAPLLLLESFRKAAEKNDFLTLDYVGSGDLYHQVVQYIDDFKLRNKVKLHNSLPNNEVYKLMREADIFLQHSITCPMTGDQEGLPVAILESMAHYLPVVSTSHAGIPEAVLDNVSGFIVEEGDTDSMAEKILILAQDDQLRLALGKVGRAIIEHNFTWDIEKNRLKNLISLIP
jgi:glycosyltransferase involved in cell wall biosynthesis